MHTELEGGRSTKIKKLARVDILRVRRRLEPYLLRDLLSRARHRRQRGDERPVRKVGKEDAAAVLRGEAGELGRRVVEADAPRGEARRHRREVVLAHAAVVARVGEGAGAAP